MSRSVFFWYSAYGGNASTQRGHHCSRSAPSTSRARAVHERVSSWSSMTGFLRRFAYHFGCSGAPPLLATAAYTPSCSTRISGTLRILPDSPRMVSSTTGRFMMCTERVVPVSAIFSTCSRTQPRGLGAYSPCIVMAPSKHDTGTGTGTGTRTDRGSQPLSPFPWPGVGVPARVGTHGIPHNKEARMLSVTESTSGPVLDDEAIAGVDAYFRAANYLSVGPIYLLDNPLLKEPLAPEHIKPRLLGHWGTTPGLNLIYAHCNRVIRERDLDMIYIIGPGHGGPAIASNSWLEGSYSDAYPTVRRDEKGLHRLFRQFSFPGGIPSHVAPELPGSIHEGGELGYSLAHAFGAAFDNPELVVTCVVGDGEAETGALATSWQSTRFINAARDGAVLPILHLNGYKIANPTVLSRIGDDALEKLLEG